MKDIYNAQVKQEH